MQSIGQFLKKEKKAFVIILVIALALEALLFNFRFWESLFFTPAALENGVPGSGLKSEGHGLYRVLEEGEYTFTYEDLNFPVKNVHYSLENATTPEGSIWVILKMKDDSVSYYYGLPTVWIIPGVERSEYQRIHLTGNTKGLQFWIGNMAPGQLLHVSSITANARVPFFFSFGRFAIVFFLLVALWICRPRSRWYGVVVGQGHKLGPAKLTFIAALVLVHCLVLWQVITAAPGQRLWQPLGEGPTGHYPLITKNLSEGRLYVDDEGYRVPPELETLDNPYDPYERSEKGIVTALDLSYYNGHYYVYFGITPVLLCYLPFYLLTGRFLTSLLPMFAFCCLFVVSYTHLRRRRW